MLVRPGWVARRRPPVWAPTQSALFAKIRISVSAAQFRAVNVFRAGLNRVTAQGLSTTSFWFTNFHAYDDLSVQKGKHSIKAGAEFIRYRYNTQVAAEPDGEYAFASL